LGLVFLVAAGTSTVAFGWNGWWSKGHEAVCSEGNCPEGDPAGGQWYWVGSPEEQKRFTISLYNRYCIRCHGVDGRGVWDIPDVPDFTDARWQACRTDHQLVRIILEGRGAVMPPFRGTLTLEQAWWLARYLRSFLPGNETERPDTGKGGDAAKKKNPEGEKAK
jgi:hypothetical protein